MTFIQHWIRTASGITISSLLLVLFLIFSACGKLDPERVVRVEITWAKALGGSKSEYPYKIIQIADGSYLLAGNSYSADGDVEENHGGQDAWLLKITSTGEIVWQYDLGGSRFDEALALLQKSSGTFLIAGATASEDGDIDPGIRYDDKSQQDIWLLELDPYGQILHQQCLGGSGKEWIRAIEETSDGGYILAATSNSADIHLDQNHGEVDYWIVKLNSSLGIQWQRSFGGSNYDDAYSARQTSDGGYIIGGDTGSEDQDVTGNHGGLDGWILKLNAAGEIIWSRCYGGSKTDYIHDIIPTTDGGYAVAGIAESSDGDVTGTRDSFDAWIFKLNSEGDIHWNICLGGSKLDIASSIVETDDGGFLIAGHTESNDGVVKENKGISNIWIIKLTPEGELDWEKTLGGSGNDNLRYLIKTVDGQYLFAGDTDSNDGDVTGNHGERDIWLVKFQWFK